MINSRKFRYHQATNTFSIEDSELGWIGLVHRESFDMVSERTGEVVTFELADTKFDAEGDLVFWRYKCISEIGKGIKAIIFND